MSISFCEECNNILFFTKEENLIFKYCNTCNIKIPAETSLLYKRRFKKDTFDANKRQYLAADPTLPRANTDCPKCNSTNIKTYLKNEGDRALNNFYFCTECLHEWKDLPFTSSPSSI